MWKLQHQVISKYFQYFLPGVSAISLIYEEYEGKLYQNCKDERNKKYYKRWDYADTNFKVYNNNILFPSNTFYQTT